MPQKKTVRERFESLSPRELKKLGQLKLAEFIDAEAHRAKARVETLKKDYPSASLREIGQRLIDTKKQLASMMGGVTGVFGAVTVPLDLAGMTYLQLSLLVEIATLSQVSLKGAGERGELLDLFGYANGIGPLQRSSPKLLGGLVTLLLAKGGMKTVSRAIPLVAAPISAYLNNQHIQRVGSAALRHYEGWSKTKKKRQRGTEK
jgi:hypothetical protein